MLLSAVGLDVSLKAKKVVLVVYLSFRSSSSPLDLAPSVQEETSTLTHIELECNARTAFRFLLFTLSGRNSTTCMVEVDESPNTSCFCCSSFYLFVRTRSVWTGWLLNFVRRMDVKFDVLIIAFAGFLGVVWLSCRMELVYVVRDNRRSAGKGGGGGERDASTPKLRIL